MSFENLIIESKATNPERRIAEERLERIRINLETITDAEGKPIDERIKETALYINAFEIPTIQYQA